MRLLRLVFKNALRNRRRTVLTALSVAVSLFLLVSLRTLTIEIKGDSLMTEQSTRRLITRSGVSLAVPLPLAYKERLRRLGGSDIVAEYQWFPCFYKEPREPMIVIATAPEFCGTDPEYPTTPAELKAFTDDVTGALIPVKMMERFGWKVGDRVTFTGTIFPFNLDVVIRGTFTGPAQNAPVCHYRYVNELLRRTMPSRADKTMAFIVRTSADHSPAALAQQIDDTFRNSDVPTRTESEKDFVLGFTSMLGNVAMFISFIAIAVVFAIVLVATNTMSMAVRERTHEIAVLKTLGFRPAQVLAMFVAESVVISGGGGIAGIVGARLFFTTFDIYKLTNGIVQHFDIKTPTVMLAIAVALAMSIVSAVVPAWRGAARPIAAGLREVA
ncbi:MAG TPA: FtsX-like permease family protein [Thermoanaerobaculia bacterium]|nr:FtsX-like permease family protein [Thermoanaerobaculia bacterium]